MTVRTIIYYPDSRLLTVSKTLAESEILSSEIQTLIGDMYETMYHAQGVGLAANQIGICQQIAVVNVSDKREKEFCIINPVILEKRGSARMQEGCLSVPGQYETVERATYVKIRAQDRQGKFFEMEAEDHLAECLQHEIDHLNGKLYVDLLSALKRERVISKMMKKLKQK